MNKILLLKRFFAVAAILLAIFTFANGFQKRTTTFAEQPEISGTSTSSTVDPLPETYITADDFVINKFEIAIPKINLQHVVKYNVDPRDKEIYLPVLDHYVAHGMFTALPSTEKGRVYLYAHSKKAPKGITPEGGYFSHINLLKKGDKVYVTLNESTYTYVVRESIIVEPTQIDVYTGESDRAEIALQTCYPPGTTEKRLILFADLESVK